MRKVQYAFQEFAEFASSQNVARHLDSMHPYLCNDSNSIIVGTEAIIAM